MALPMQSSSSAARAEKEEYCMGFKRIDEKSATNQRLALRLCGLFAAGLLGACVQPQDSGEEAERSRAANTVSGTPRVMLSGSSNKRWFVDSSGSPVFMSGSHTWNNFVDRGGLANLNYSSYVSGMNNN